MSEHQELSEPYVGMVSCRVLLLAVGLLFFVALVDPADTIFHLKEPVFVSVILIWVLRRGLMRRTLTKLIWIVTFTLVFVIPLIWTMIGLLNNGLHSADAQFGLLKCFLFLLLLPVAISEDIDLVALLIRISILIALLTIAMCVISYLLPSLFVALYAISLDKQNAMIAPSRDVVGIGLGMFYYKTSALMIFPFTYYFSRLLRRKIRWWLSFLLCLLFGAALFISGTRANALAVVLVVGILMLNRIRLAGGWIAALMIGVMGVILLAVTIIPKFADTQEHGNAIKLGHFRSYEHEFSEKPSVLLWGEGAGSAFYSEGIQNWSTGTELTYLELVRVFGLPMTVVFGAGLLWIAYALLFNAALSGALAYLAYLAIAASDPLLLSSTGMIVMCAVLKQALRPSGDKSMFHLSEHY